MSKKQLDSILEYVISDPLGATAEIHTEAVELDDIGDHVPEFPENFGYDKFKTEKKKAETFEQRIERRFEEVALLAQSAASQASRAALSGQQAGGYAEVEIEELVNNLISGNITSYIVGEQATDRQWIDGKVIYEAVFDISAGADSAILATGIENLVEQAGQITDGTIQYPAPSDTGTDWVYARRLANSDLELRRGGTYATPRDGEYLVIRYTKV